MCVKIDNDFLQGYIESLKMTEDNARLYFYYSTERYSFRLNSTSLKEQTN